LLAALGTTFLENLISPIVKLFTKSPASMVIREWICSIVISALMAALVQGRWRTSTARWVWTIGLLWFLYGLTGGFGLPVENRWRAFSGIACSETRGIACVQFWSFTVPLVRCTFYSIGACLASARMIRDQLAKSQVVVSRLLAGLFLVGLSEIVNDENAEERTKEDRTE
jgi:hypothetical protein